MQVQPAELLEHSALSRYPFKIVVLGEYGVGKTALVRRYTQGTFIHDYKPTIGVDFALRTVEIKEVKLSLQFWDVAGQERFNSIISLYFRFAKALIVVCDVTRQDALQSAARWKLDFDQKVQVHVPSILLLNKIDLLPNGMLNRPSPDELALFADENGFDGWFTTSARENINVEEAMEFFTCLIHQVYFVDQSNLMQSKVQGLGLLLEQNEAKNKVHVHNKAEKRQCKQCNLQ